MSKQIRVDNDFDKLLKRMAKDLERELGFKPSKTNITKSIVCILNDGEIKIKNGKRIPKKKLWEVTFEIQ